MNTLSVQEFYALESNSLAARIEQFFHEEHTLRHGNIGRFTVTTATEILATSAVQGLTEDQRAPEHSQIAAK